MTRRPVTARAQSSAWTWLVPVLLIAVSAYAEDSTTSLIPAQTFTRELQAGESQRYVLEARAGQIWRIVVEQQGINVTVTARGRDGESFSVNSPNRRLGTELMVLSPQVDGYLDITVAAKKTTGPAGPYSIRADLISVTSDLERARLAAEETMSRAASLNFRETVEARREAVMAYGRAAQQWRAIDQPRHEACALQAGAILHRFLEEHRQAITLGEQALKRWQTLEKPAWQGISLTELGLNHWSLGEIPEARALLEKALSLTQALGDSYEEAAIHNSLGLTYHAAGELRQALPRYQRALALFRQARDTRTTASLLNNVGNVYRSLGEPQQALDHFRESLAMRRAAGDRTGEANTLNSIAVVYRRLGDIQDALTFYSQSLEVYRELGNRRREASTLSNIGIAYHSLGESRRALSFLRQALPLRRETGDRRGEAVTLNNLGQVHRDLGEPEEALELHLEALELTRAVGDRRRETVALELAGRAQFDLGDVATAGKSFGRALELARITGDRGREAEALHQKGRVELWMQDAAKAQESFSRALELQRSVKDRNGEVQSMTALARALRALGRTREACSLVEEALVLVESLRVRLGSPQLRASFLGTQRAAYELQIDLLMDLHREQPDAGFDHTALAISERSRARTLLDLLHEGDADLEPFADPALRQRRENLRQRLSAKAERQLALLSRKHSAEQAAAFESERYAALAELEEVEAEIRRSDPRYAALTRPRLLDADEIRALLDPETVLLEYSLGEERSFAWLVTSARVRSFELPPRQTIEQAARAAHARFSTLRSGRGRRDSGHLHDLGNMLLGPMVAELADRRLLIVADGALNYVPFAALPLPVTAKSTAPELVIDRHEIVYLPSASTLAARHGKGTRPQSRKWLAILADPVFDRHDPRITAPSATLESSPTGSSSSASERYDLSELAELERLPATRREAQALAALAPAGDVFTALDFAADRATLFSRELADYRIVHLATHGVIDSQEPELSGLVLSLVDSAGQPQEGFVRLWDVYDLDLGAELVVLSGCQTALGKEIRGEGLVGLTRGFMYAGVPEVMASLWRVQDRATTQLMTSFYHQLRHEGLSTAAALRQAQLTIRRQRGWRDPYFWAAFVIQGEWRGVGS